MKSSLGRIIFPESFLLIFCCFLNLKFQKVSWNQKLKQRCWVVYSKLLWNAFKFPADFFNENFLLNLNSNFIWILWNSCLLSAYEACSNFPKNYLSSESKVSSRCLKRKWQRSRKILEKFKDETESRKFWWEILRLKFYFLKYS